MSPAYTRHSHSHSRSRSPSLCALTLIACAGVTFAQPAMQALPAIYKAVEDHLRAPASHLPPDAIVRVGRVDDRLALPACAALNTFNPPGARAWGHTTVGVRCDGPLQWQIHVPAQIIVNGIYLTTSRALGAGHAITAADLTPASADIAQLPAGVATQLEQVLGKTMANSLAAGQPLRLDALRAPLVVQQGQAVKLITRGAGFQVSAEGQALGSASDGQLTQARLPSGQIVSGVARAGAIIEVRM